MVNGEYNFRAGPMSALKGAFMAWITSELTAYCNGTRECQRTLPHRQCSFNPGRWFGGTVYTHLVT